MPAVPKKLTLRTRPDSKIFSKAMDNKANACSTHKSYR